MNRHSCVFGASAADDHVGVFRATQQGVYARLLVAATLVLAYWTTAANAAPNKAPTVVITAPANGATYTAPATITISANATDTDGTISRVDFYQGTIYLGRATTPPYSLTWSSVAGGTYALTAIAIDNAGATKTSAAVSISVTGAKLIVTSPAPGSVVDAGSIAVSGSFFGDASTTVLIDNGVTSRVASINGSTFSATLPVSVGSNSFRITATRRDRTFDQTTVVVTGKAPPLLVFTSPAANNFDAPATIPLIVDAMSPVGTIAKVDFLRGSTLLGTSTFPPYLYTWSNVPAGTYAVTARATDDKGSTSTASLSIRVNAGNVLPIVSLTSPANASSFVAPATVALMASASDPDGTIGLVEFLQNGAVIGTMNVAPYSMNWNTSVAGTYTLTARATDNRAATAVSSPVNIVVNPRPNTAPSVTLTAPAPGSSYIAPASMALQAIAGDSDGSVSKVDFYAAETLIGTATTAPYAMTWANVPTGTYALTAKATDDQGATSTTPASTVIVTANAPPTISLTAPPANSTFYVGNSIVLSATASDIDDVIARVEFYRGTILIGIATAPPYSINWNGAAAGDYLVQAVAVDSAGTSASSIAIPIHVKPLSFAITSPADGSTITGNLVTVSGTLQAPANSGLTVNGVTAAVDTDGNFYAAAVGLVPGSNVITATLTTADGQARTQSITLTSVGSAPIVVRASPLEGVAPLPVTFDVTAGAGTTIARVEIDGDGNGTTDFSIQRDPWSTVLTFSGTGTVTASLRVTDTDGHVHTSVIPIVLHSQTTIDQTIRAVWSGLKNAFAAADKGAAMQYLSPSLQQRYSAPLDDLLPKLPQIAASFSDLQPVTLSSELGEYAINRQINGDDRIFFIYFGRDGDGVWRVQSM